MKRLFPWTSSAEGRLEAWLAKQHEARVYSGETTPVGSCPDDSFLRELARKSKSIDLLDQRIDHVANCAKCLPRLTLFRTELRTQQRRWQLALAGAACVILIAALLFVPQWSQRRHEKRIKQCRGVKNGGSVERRHISWTTACRAESTGFARKEGAAHNHSS